MRLLWTLYVACCALPAQFLTDTALARDQPEVGCERQTIAMQVSPDDLWTALVQEELCTRGPAFTTVILDRVQLVRRAAASTEAGDVLAVDEGGHPENRPLLQWLSPKKLQITIPNKSLISLQKGSYEEIELVIKYVPDDPAERERWLKELGLAPR